MAEPSKTLGSTRFGPFDLSVETGELRKNGVRLKLTGQPIQVLIRLVAKRGSLVTREELQRELCRGYRFLATLDSPLSPQGQSDVVGPVAPPKPESPERELKPRRPRWWKRKTTIAVASCVVVAGLLYPWIRPRIERLVRLNQIQQLTSVPLTALPGIVWSPTFSPDGSQVAFVWTGGHVTANAGPNPWANSNLYVKVIGSDKPLQLTYTGGVSRAAWSHDGRSIALLRYARDDSGVFLISPLGGPERKIAFANCPCFVGAQISWSPDGRQLAFPDHPANSQSHYTERLFVLSLDSMERVPVKTDCNLVSTPAFSPGGDYLAWFCADNLSSFSIHLQRLSDGSVTQLLHGVDGIGGMAAWSRDDRRIIFTKPASGGDLWEVELARPNHAENDGRRAGGVREGGGGRGFELWRFIAN